MPSDNSPSSREEVRTFWTGPALSYYEILSLKSFVATGARVFVYSYEKDLNVPDGVELVDADEILSGEVHEFRHANGDKSLALHSDLFRYAVLQRYGGWYADLDIVVLKDKLPDAKTYFGFMADKLLNSAILKFPPHSAFMDTIMREAWQTLPEASADYTDAARVSVGPTLFTRMIYEHGMDHLVLPKVKAYELAYHETMAFFDPKRCDEALERLADADFTHLWNEEWRMIRIPKNFGPPKGSFLDVLFKRFGIDIPDRARLQPEAIEAWMREHRLLKDIRVKLGIERIGPFTLDELAYSIQNFGWEARDHVYHHWYYGIEYDQPKWPKHPQASNPQTLRTFWHGDSITPYQLLCLRSFVEHGHRVEVFSYNLKMAVPKWLVLRDAEEILPQADILHEVDGRTAIRANRFRWALLKKFGGWWIDPDIMLMKPELPDAEIFFGNPDVFGQVPTAVLKFPKGHALIDEALALSRAASDAPESERAGSEMLTGLVAEHGFDLAHDSEKSLGPIDWFNVLDLFDPSKAVEMAGRIGNERFLHIHNEVWRRAGIHPWLAPPAGAFLDALFGRYEVGIRFPARMHFHQVKRWVTHMQKSMQIDRAAL
ncbi:MAG: hypothetical protein J0I29_05155 [Rhizobiales bacterium]|nr:hypothetical protein [Hyphomicrobiales bacterium]